jgi:hypothetical protein
MKCGRFVSSSYFTRWDWLLSLSRLRFYLLTCLRFSVESVSLWFFSTFSFAFVQLFFIFRLSSRSLRNHYLTLSLFIDDHDAMIVRWSSTRKRKLLKREISTKLCCVVCASLNRERVKVAKILRAEIEFRVKKREFDVILKRFEVRFVRLSVYDLFCRSFSKRNHFVIIEDDERRFWWWKSRALELIWRRRRDWRSELTRNERREFRRRRSFELTENSRRDDSKDRVSELIERLRQSRREDKRMSRDESMRRRWERKEKKRRL